MHIQDAEALLYLLGPCWQQENATQKSYILEVALQGAKEQVKPQTWCTKYVCFRGSAHIFTAGWHSPGAPYRYANFRPNRSSRLGVDAKGIPPSRVR